MIRHGLKISPAMLPSGIGNNICHPSVIRAPSWLPNPLGKFYVYFGSHIGEYVRLAYTNDIRTGSYQIYAPGALKLYQAPLCYDVLGAPDVHINNATQRIVMYFRARSLASGSLATFRADSVDGRNFYPVVGELGDAYFRVFEFNGLVYALDGHAYVYRSVDGGMTFQKSHRVFVPNTGETRHYGVHVSGDTLVCYFTKQGDAPEHVRRATMPLVGDWTSWQQGTGSMVIKPETNYEGANLPITVSQNGPAYVPERALRDPYPYITFAGDTLLFYAVAGEQGIAVAEPS